MVGNQGLSNSQTLSIRKTKQDLMVMVGQLDLTTLPPLTGLELSVERSEEMHCGFFLFIHSLCSEIP